MTDASNLTDHYKGIDILAGEKGKQFQHAQTLNTFNKKKNIPVTKLRHLRESLASGEANTAKKLKLYKDSFQSIVTQQREELVKNYDIIQYLSRYVNYLIEAKEATNIRFEKLVKMIKAKLGNYSEELPLVELWSFLIKKYESMSKNNSLYIVFISNIKKRMDKIADEYLETTKDAYRDVVKL